jgi:hypothetical protein
MIDCTPSFGALLIRNLADAQRLLGLHSALCLRACCVQERTYSLPVRSVPLRVSALWVL